MRRRAEAIVMAVELQLENVCLGCAWPFAWMKG